MMNKLVLSCCSYLIVFQLYAQIRTTSPGSPLSRPKLVVGIVVDQMRWDFLYRYYDRYSPTGGFKRFLTQGFSCENTFIPYTPTVTACGHTCIYTGSVPSIHGITGNLWWDRHKMTSVYCTEDDSVTTIGTNSAAGQQSPRNMLVTTICDELRLATNFRSKVIGIAFKDRGGILPAGHSANAAYWYDGGSGNWISSSYYMKDLPQWVKDFNAKKLVDKYYEQNWNTLFPINTYLQSTSDDQPYEAKPFGADQRAFPYNLKKFIGKSYYPIASTPYGNTFTVELAKAAVNAESLGVDNITDFLAVSFSSPDYIGHAFGPNSIEIEDTYLRLDKDLEDLFSFLDNKVGKDQYLVFLSADHAVAHVPAFMKEHKFPAGVINEEAAMAGLNNQLKQQFGIGGLVVSTYNYQIHLNHRIMDSAKLDGTAIKKWIIEHLRKQEGVAQAFEISELMNTPLAAKAKNMLANGYFPRRGGDIQILLEPHWIDGFNTGTTHGLWNPYDSHIPLLWYGWNIKPGKTHREVYMTDIAPTIAALLRIQMPSGSVGDVIGEIVK